MELNKGNSNILELLKEQSMPNAIEMAMIKEICNNEKEQIFMLTKCFLLGEIIGKRKERSRRTKK